MAAVRWMLTIAFRVRPGNIEWNYKTVVSRRPPEKWLTDRLGPLEMGDVPRLEVNILYAREIDEDAAQALAARLEERGG